MSKRALRRHHEARIKRKFRNVAKRWAGRTDSFVNRWRFPKPGQMVHFLDPEGFRKREEFIERTVRRLAHHNKCPCGMCKRPRYNRIAVRRGRPNNY